MYSIVSYTSLLAMWSQTCFLLSVWFPQETRRKGKGSMWKVGISALLWVTYYHSIIKLMVSNFSIQTKIQDQHSISVIWWIIMTYWGVTPQERVFCSMHGQVFEVYIYSYHVTLVACITLYLTKIWLIVWSKMWGPIRTYYHNSGI